MNDLRSHVLGLEGTTFAVLDGAQFDDLPDQLMNEDLAHRSLYKDRGLDGSADYERTAPRLLCLDDQPASSRGDTLSKLFEIVGDRPAVVFWEAPEDGETLYRHLRSINRVQIPADTDASDEPVSDVKASDFEDAANSLLQGDPEPFRVLERVSGSSPDSDAMSQIQDEHADVDGSASQLDANLADEEWETVVFRHADANVLAQIVPTLNEGMRSRLMGCAVSIAFAPSPAYAASNAVHFYRNADPRRHSGMLRIGDAELDDTDAIRLEASRAQVRSYLVETAPELTEALSLNELDEAILLAERTGDEIGIESEYGHGLWALLHLMTGGSLSSSTELRNYFASSDKSPDELVEELFEQLAASTDEDWDAWDA